MRIAVTGTPGTGKSSATALLSDTYTVYSVKELAERYGCGEQEGEEVLVDIECLNEKVECEDCIIEGHLSHLLNPDIIIILRCHPEVLKKRLEPRGYGEEKLRENMEAEAIDIILEEAMEMGKPVFEIDSTDRRPKETAEAIKEITRGKTGNYEAGKIDWSEVVLSWY